MPQKEGRRETPTRTETEADPRKTEHPPLHFPPIRTQSPRRRTRSERGTPRKGRGFTERRCRTHRSRWIPGNCWRPRTTDRGGRP